MRHNCLVHTLLLCAMLLCTPATLVFAQADGSAVGMGSDPAAGGAAPAAQAAIVPSVSEARATSTSAGAPAPLPSATIAEPAMQPSVPTSGAPVQGDVVTEEEPQAPAGLNTGMLTLLAGTVTALLALLGVAYVVRGSQKQKTSTESTKCDSIKALLEQKKKELEELVRHWPEEKLKAVAKNAVFTEIKKDTTAKAVIETIDEAQAAYNKLKKAIDLLEMRYDLCTLSLPSVGGAWYTGTIIENSLQDPKILENVKVVKHYEAGAWKLKDVSVSEKQINKLGETLQDGPWYMHFWKENKEDGIVVFKDKQFPISYTDSETWKDAVAHGRALGIPAAQLDFVISA